LSHCGEEKGTEPHGKGNHEMGTFLIGTKMTLKVDQNNHYSLLITVKIDSLKETFQI
jgi:hypothetical protein